MTADPTPPTTPPPTPPAPPAEASTSTSLSPARIVAGLGAIVTVVSIFLNWAHVSGGQLTAKGSDVPFDFLWDKHTTSSDPSLVLPLLVAALLIGLGVLLPTARLAGIIGGVLVIAVAVVYCIQAQGLIDDGGTNLSLTDFISTGVYVAFVGGILGLVGAAIPSKT